MKKRKTESICIKSWGESRNMVTGRINYIEINEQKYRSRESIRLIKLGTELGKMIMKDGVIRELEKLK